MRSGASLVQGQDERIVSVHGLRDFGNMKSHLDEERKEERAEDHATRTDAAQVQGAYSP